MKKLKVLHILSQKPSFTGSGTFFQQLVKACSLHNIDQALFYCTSINDDNTVYFEEIPTPNQKILLFNTEQLPYNLPGMSDIMPYPSSLFSKMSIEEILTYKKILSENISNLIHEYQPDIIWSHHLWIASALSKSLFPNIPHIVFCHGSDIRQMMLCPNETIKNWIASNICLLDLVLSASIAQSLEIASLYGIDKTQIRAIGGAIDTKTFYLPEAHLQNENKVTLTFVGKICKAKGVDIILNSAIYLRKKNIPFTINMIGNGVGTEANELIQKASLISDDIRLLGQLDSMSLATVLRNSDIFVFPSFHEGIGLVVLEAIACGCRVIVNDYPHIVTALTKNGEARQYVSFLKLPKMETIDKPFENELPQYQEQFNLELERQIMLSKSDNMETKRAIGLLVKDYSWNNLFNDILLLSYGLLKKNKNIN